MSEVSEPSNNDPVVLEIGREITSGLHLPPAPDELDDTSQIRLENVLKSFGQSGNVKKIIIQENGLQLGDFTAVIQYLGHATAARTNMSWLPFPNLETVVFTGRCLGVKGVDDLRHLLQERSGRGSAASSRFRLVFGDQSLFTETYMELRKALGSKNIHWCRTLRCGTSCAMARDEAAGTRDW